jgi:hypothetical protein
MKRESVGRAVLDATGIPRPGRELTLPEQSHETPVLDLLTTMTTASLETTTLDAETAMLVRIAALVAVDAPPASYLRTSAPPPSWGSGRTKSVPSSPRSRRSWAQQRSSPQPAPILRALGFALEMAEMEAAED